MTLRKNLQYTDKKQIETKHEYVSFSPKHKQKTSKKDEPSRERQKNCMAVAMLKQLQYFCRALAVFESKFYSFTAKTFFDTISPLKFVALLFSTPFVHLMSTLIPPQNVKPPVIIGNRRTKP